MDTRTSHTRAGRVSRAILSSTGFFVLLAAIVFLPAGRVWWKGLAFLGVFVLFTLASVPYLRRKNPDIFVARGRIHEGTKPWDKVVMALLMTSFFAIFPVASLDARFGWSRMPLWLTAAGYVLFAGGFTGSIWVYSVNKFAEPSVRIQADRGQTVVSAGPYGIVRHPLYAASFILVGGMPLALGSYWTFIPVASGILVIIVRTVLEDRMLKNELAGYKEYAARVRYRLIPGIW